MPVQRVAGAATDSACVAVLLPGRWNRPEAFIEAGFGEALRERDLDVTLILPDAHLGYYRDGGVVDRLERDVFALPEVVQARVLVVGGASLGGFGTLLQLAERPGLRVEAVVLLAPYLGPEDVVDEVVAAGGLRAWAPPEQLGTKDFRKIWGWLWRWDRGGQQLPLWMSWGREDDLAPALAPLVAVVEPARLAPVEGGHDWKTWRRGWEALLDRGLLADCQTLETP